MKKICPFIIVLMLLIGILWYCFQQKMQKDFFEQGIYSQYAAINLMYQTGNFTIPFEKQYIFNEFGDTAPQRLKVAIDCNQTGCFSPYILQVKSLEAEFGIRRVLVYPTINSESGKPGPYYLQQEPFLIVKKGEEAIIDAFVYYNNLSGTNIPSFLPKKYGSFVYQNPIELYYVISPVVTESTGASAIVSLQKG